MRWETWGEASLVTLNQAEVEVYQDTHSSKQEREQMHFIQLNKVRMTLLSFFGFASLTL
jgi:hypothetical protein